MRDRAQISIFMVLGIFLLVIAAGAFAFLALPKTGQDSGAVRSLLSPATSACLEMETERGISLYGLDSRKVALFIEEGFPSCIGYAVSRQQGYSLVAGPPSATVEIRERSVYAQLDMSMRAVKGSTSIALVPPSITIPLASELSIPSRYASSAMNLASGDRNLDIALPAGTTATNEGSPVSAVSIRTVSAETETVLAYSVAYDIGPSGTVFSKPIELTIHYQDSDFTEEEETSLSIVYYDELAGLWKTIPSQPDPAQNLVKGSVQHLTTFALSLDCNKPEQGILFFDTSYMYIQNCEPCNCFAKEAASEKVVPTDASLADCPEESKKSLNSNLAEKSFTEIEHMLNRGGTKSYEGGTGCQIDTSKTPKAYYYDSISEVGGSGEYKFSITGKGCIDELGFAEGLIDDAITEMTLNGNSLIIPGETLTEISPTGDNIKAINEKLKQAVKEGENTLSVKVRNDDGGCAYARLALKLAGSGAAACKGTVSEGTRYTYVPSTHFDCIAGSNEKDIITVEVMSSTNQAIQHPDVEVTENHGTAVSDTIRHETFDPSNSQTKITIEAVEGTDYKLAVGDSRDTHHNSKTEIVNVAYSTGEQRACSDGARKSGQRVWTVKFIEAAAAEKAACCNPSQTVAGYASDPTLNTCLEGVPGTTAVSPATGCNKVGIMTLLQDAGDTEFESLANQHLTWAHTLTGDGGWVLLIAQTTQPISRFARYVELAKQKNLNPIIRIMTSFENNAWRIPIGEEQKYADIAVQSGADYVQIHNEPNRKDQWGGLPVNAEQYAQFVIDVSRKIKDANSNIKVISAGLSPKYEGTTQDDFLKAMASVEGFSDAIDYWGSHSYLDDADPNQYVKELQITGITKPVIITEAGIKDDGHSTHEAMATQITDAIIRWNADTSVKAALFFELLDARGVDWGSWDWCADKLQADCAPKLYYTKVVDLRSQTGYSPQCE